MDTELDSCYEILFDRLCYDGSTLNIEVTEQIVQKNRAIRPSSESRRFKVTVNDPISYFVVEEFAASVANLTRSEDSGFLRRIESNHLVEALGLSDVYEEPQSLRCYALITSHEIIVIFTNDVPVVSNS